jgi:hypothetical protein
MSTGVIWADRPDPEADTLMEVALASTAAHLVSK